MKKQNEIKEKIIFSPVEPAMKFTDKKTKEENYLPFTLHADNFIPPSHYIIKRETQAIFQVIEKDMIELERKIKGEFISFYYNFL